MRPTKLALAKKHRRFFFNTFGVHIEEYMHPIFGFDIIRFDEEVIKPDPNISTAQAIAERYGMKAVYLIRNLL